jgi:hypothetical protein
MKILVFISILILKTQCQQNVTLQSLGQNVTSLSLKQNVVSICSTDLDCIHGRCYNKSVNVLICICDRGWIYSRDGQNICNYQQKSKLGAFLLSFFLGGFGSDWYYLSTGNRCYIVAGVFKMLTFGGLGIWWLVDWMRILTNSFNDGQRMPLLEWSP